MLYHFIASTKVQEANIKVHIIRCKPDVQILSCYGLTTLELTLFYCDLTVLG